MKNSSTLLTLLAFTTTINIDSGWAMLPSMENISKITVKKKVPTQMVQKRYLSTQGYQPKEPIKLEFQFDNITKEKVRFTDKSHERYRPERPKSFSGEFVAIPEKIDDHTVIVNIKKKEIK